MYKRKSEHHKKKMAQLLSYPDKLKLYESNDASNAWKKFRQSWELFEIASETNTKDDKIRVATFLHVAGSEAVEKYNGFTWNEGQDKNKMKDVLEKFDKDCKQKCNVLLERKIFFGRKQEERETCDQYLTQLRLLASSCQFSNKEEAIRDQFSFNIRSNRAKEKILEKAQKNYEDLTIEKAASIAKLIETSERSSNDNGIKPQEEIYVARKDKKVTSGQQKDIRREFNCTRCGTLHKPRSCPAFGKKCGKCGALNHFSRVCRTSKNSYRENMFNAENQDGSEEKEDATSEEECI